MYEGPLPKRGHNYQMLQVVDVVQETAGAKSVVLEVPRHLKSTFTYRAGQFLTIRLRLTGNQHIRCYSMSSSPAVDENIRITVKRVEGGVVSNWFNQWAKPGLKVESMLPSGDFVLTDAADEHDIVAFCSGSGITPVFSIASTALATTGRRVRVYYANQQRDAIIFADALAKLIEEHPGRIEVVHHVYDEIGYLATQQVIDFLAASATPDVYVCGSRHFNATTREALTGLGLPSESVHFENFTPDDTLAPADDASGLTVDRAAAVASSRTETINVRLRGQRISVPYEKGETVLDAGRRASISPPFACESGICGACIGFMRDGEVLMAGGCKSLSAEEAAEGWVLACRAIPQTPTIEIEFPA